MHILLAIGPEERHGYAIMQEVARITGGAVKLGPGAIYTTIKRLLADLPLEDEAATLREQIANLPARSAKRTKAIKRLKVIKNFLGENSPLGMVLDAVPVIPPDLRPMVQLDGGRFATSDLNDLYRRVINRNNQIGRAHV